MVWIIETDDTFCNNEKQLNDSAETEIVYKWKFFNFFVPVIKFSLWG
jgi:hypothetical protein